jgi:hypothetical protein
LLAVAAVGCSDDDMDTGGMGGQGGSGAVAVTFTADIHPILQMKCGLSNCHDQPNPFIPGHGAADVNVAYMQATQIGSLNQPIYDRILIRAGSTDPLVMMPPNPPCEGALGRPGCLTQDEYDLIKEWVDQGHPK